MEDKIWVNNGRGLSRTVNDAWMLELLSTWIRRAHHLGKTVRSAHLRKKAFTTTITKATNNWTLATWTFYFLGLKQLWLAYPCHLCFSIDVKLQKLTSHDIKYPPTRNIFQYHARSEIIFSHSSKKPLQSILAKFS